MGLLVYGIKCHIHGQREGICCLLLQHIWDAWKDQRISLTLLNPKSSVLYI